MGRVRVTVRLRVETLDGLITRSGFGFGRRGEGVETDRSDRERGKTAMKKDERWADRCEGGGEEGHEPRSAAHAGGTAVVLLVAGCGFGTGIAIFFTGFILLG